MSLSVFDSWRMYKQEKARLDAQYAQDELKLIANNILYDLYKEVRRSQYGEDKGHLSNAEKIYLDKIVGFSIIEAERDIIAALNGAVVELAKQKKLVVSFLGAGASLLAVNIIGSSVGALNPTISAVSSIASGGIILSAFVLHHFRNKTIGELNKTVDIANEVADYIDVERVNKIREYTQSVTGGDSIIFDEMEPFLVTGTIETLEERYKQEYPDKFVNKATSPDCDNSNFISYYT